MKHLLNGMYKAVMLILILLLNACSSDDPGPSGDYVNGIFVINEGNYGDGDGSVSFFHRKKEEVIQTIFQEVNDELALGDVVQSAFIHDGLTYLVINNSNKVEVVKTNTFDREFTMEVELPRYMTTSQGKGFLTSWESFIDPGQVTIFDLKTGAIEEEISVGSLPEDIEVIGNKIYVTEAFGSNLMYIIDMENNNAITTLELADGTNQLMIDNNNHLWISCMGGDSGFPDYVPKNNGKLVKFNPETNTVIATIELSLNFAGKIAMNNDGTTLYFYVGNGVYTVDIASSEASSNPLFKVEDSFGFYGIGADPKTGNVLVADAGDFLVDGEVHVYDANGAMITSFTVGRIPNGFAFN